MTWCVLNYPVATGWAAIPRGGRKRIGPSGEARASLSGHRPEQPRPDHHGLASSSPISRTARATAARSVEPQITRKPDTCAHRDSFVLLAEYTAEGWRWADATVSGA